MSENWNVTNKTKTKLPSLVFDLFPRIKKEVMGDDYELSLVFVEKEEIHALNKKYRDKDAPTDILSFPLDETTGEIYINLELTEEEAKKFDRPYLNFLPFLFIHGLVHLKGHEHGGTMERIEEGYRKIFGI